MQQTISDEYPPVLVEFTLAPGLKKVSRTDQEIVEKSTKALDSAMNSIQQMARRVSTTVNDLTERPDQVKVEFGIKLDGEVGALIAKTGIEASINVTITWGGRSP